MLSQFLTRGRAELGGLVKLWMVTDANGCVKRTPRQKHSVHSIDERLASTVCTLCKKVARSGNAGRPPSPCPSKPSTRLSGSRPRLAPPPPLSLVPTNLRVRVLRELGQHLH